MELRRSLDPIYRSHSSRFDVELVSSSISNRADSDRHELRRLFGGANRSFTASSFEEEGGEDTRANNDIGGSSDRQRQRQRQWQGDDGDRHQRRPAASTGR
ncbi:hypothetical protein LOK49_LG06G01839 [Camellia lanceoleosa]|uniref:Uncharacterized protein n=1 Tax=Camellia lanceoleosa TaxID=1840588 RepID=A0ACC0HF60_9ERIC|nr:hypothetical protein LOK49_LG06G01839 [Camellia lanceoleosa]